MALAEIDPEERRWTLDEFIRLDTLGFLDEGRWELLQGRIFRKMGQNKPHLVATMLATQALQKAFGKGFTVTQNLPYHLSEIDAPEPDVAVFKGDIEDYEPFTPEAEDLALVVEVADTRMDTAVGVKAEIYARHRICEYWIIDVRTRTIQVRRNSDGESFCDISILSEQDSITPLLSPASPILVKSLLPKKNA